MTGRTISHFKVLDKLGAGGMGEVYLAQDTKLDRQVALKVLQPHALATEDDRARFYREARAAAALNHANIATVYEIDESFVVPAKAGTSQVLAEPPPSTESRLFIAMELVEGESLAERIARGPLPLPDVISIGSQIAGGLAAAHAKDIVHRDVKPSNVMLTQTGEAKMLDFGLAKTAASTKLTRMGSTLGTFAYMSPEQARGEEVDARTDVWSLGAVLYEMITGRVPFPGEYEQAVVYEILNEDPEPPTAVRTGVPMELERIVLKCLSKHRRQRYQHVDEVAVDLGGVDLKPFGLSTIAPAVAVAAGTRSRLLSLPIVAIVAVVAAAIGAFAVAMLRPETEPRVSRQHLLVEQRWPSQPALSPDGRLLAYRGYDAGNYVAGLHIYDFETGEVRTVPGLAASWPRFSPDGSRVAFYSSGRIVTVSSTGGSPAVVVPQGASWTFAWGANGDLYFSTGGYQEVVRLDAADASQSTVMAVDSLRGEVAVYPYQMLPGDKYLLAGLTRGSPERDDLVAIDVKTGISTDLLPEAGWGAYYAPTGHVVYVTSDSGPLYVRLFDPKRLKVTGPPIQASPEVQAVDWRFSASGRFANVVRSEPRERLLQVTPDQLVTALPVDTTDLDVFRVSPSGRYLALTAYSEGKGWEVLIYDTVSSTHVPLAYQGVDQGSPSWSPDESSLAYTSKLETTNRIYVSRVDGSGSPQLLARTTTHTIFPDWSPDGAHVVFVTEGDLWIYSFADSTARPMVPRINERGNQGHPRFSPDGRYLAYGSNEAGEWEVFVARVDGTAKWRITSGGFAPAWSTDQSRIFVSRGSTIHEIRVDTGRGFRILGESVVYSSDRQLKWFDVLPNSEGFVVAEQIEAATHHFEIVDNWFQYLEQIAPKPK